MLSQRLFVRILVPLVIILVPLTIYLAPNVASIFLSVLAALAPLWLPTLIILVGIPLWISFVRSHFVHTIPYTIIELQPGSETPRSARAMELVFYSLYHRTELSLFETYALGHMRTPWSFEIMAHNGLVRFFVHLPNAHRAAVESRIRAEYLDIDINQVRDYAREIDFNPATHVLHMREFTLVKPDPYPLKTYALYEADKTRRDVMEELLEEMSHISEHEYLLLSFILRPHQRERRKFFEIPRDYLHEDARHEIESLLGSEHDIHAASADVKQRIAAIEGALKKPSFDCGARALYIGVREKILGDEEERLAGILDRFNNENFNKFSAYDPTEKIGWPLSEIFAVVPALSSDYLLQLYRRRAFFAPPYYGDAFVLNTEELATIFHIPHFARASALSNMRGIRLEPPANLPV